MHQRVLFATFRNVMILAKFASQIAARSAKAENWRSRQKVIEWFFLYWINAKPTGAAIGVQKNLVTLPFANKAETTLAVF
jgi:hypothetical protein